MLDQSVKILACGTVVEELGSMALIDKMISGSWEERFVIA